MEEFIPKEQIRSHLMVFASKAISTGKLEDQDPNMVNNAIFNLVSETQGFMVDLINNHLKSKLKPFNQVLSDTCKRCSLKYSETGRVTNREYFYCIRTDNSSFNVPVNCPGIEKTKKFEVVNETDDDAILDIRKKYGRNG